MAEGDDRLLMYITTTDEDRDMAHRDITKIKYISAQQKLTITAYLSELT